MRDAVNKLDKDSGGLLNMAAHIAVPELEMVDTADNISKALASGDNKGALEGALDGVLQHYTGVDSSQMEAIAKGLKSGNPESIAESIQLVASSEVGEKLAKNPKFAKLMENVKPLAKHAGDIVSITKAVKAGHYEDAMAEALVVAVQHQQETQRHLGREPRRPMEPHYGPEPRRSPDDGPSMGRLALAQGCGEPIGLVGLERGPWCFHQCFSLKLPF